MTELCLRLCSRRRVCPRTCPTATTASPSSCVSTSSSASEPSPPRGTSPLSTSQCPSNWSHLSIQGNRKHQKATGLPFGNHSFLWEVIQMKLLLFRTRDNVLFHSLLLVFRVDFIWAVFLLLCVSGTGRRCWSSCGRGLSWFWRWTSTASETQTLRNWEYWTPGHTM